MNKINLCLLCICCLFGLESCHSSYIYNTSLLLPAEPMKEADIQITGELGMLPEALPESAGNHAIFSGGILARYAVTQSFYLDARVYATLNNGFDLTDNPSGAGAGFNIILNDIHSDFVYGLRLSYERAWTGSDDGDGIGLQVFSWLPSFYSIRPFAAIGTGFAIGDDGLLGYGLVGNFGVSYELVNNLNLNLEFSPIMQINTENKISHGVYTATAGLSWIF